MYEQLRPHLWWILGTGSLAAIGLFAAFGRVPMPFDWTAVIIGFALIAVLANSPVPVGQAEIDLSHTVSIVMGLILGPSSCPSDVGGRSWRWIPGARLLGSVGQDGGIPPVRAFELG